jgi:hypothetical protein
VKPTGDDARSAVDAKVMVEVRVVFADESMDTRSWTWGDVNSGTPVPAIEMQPWMVDPRRSWPDPQGPIYFSSLVAPEHEAEARAWLESLRPG